MAHRVHHVADAETGKVFDIGVEQNVAKQLAYIWEEIGRAREHITEQILELEERIEALEKQK